MKISIGILSSIILGYFFIGSIPIAESTIEDSRFVPVVVEKKVYIKPTTIIPIEEKLQEVSNNQELDCLARNIYHEARGEHLAGMFAVADVVLNRVKSTEFPDTICDVVYQAKLDANGTPKKFKCQFSWYCDGKSDEIADEESWIESQLVSYNIVVTKKHIGITEGAKFYHVSTLADKPYWHEAFDELGDIGDHTFYVMR